MSDLIQSDPVLIMDSPGSLDNLSTLTVTRPSLEQILYSRVRNIVSEESAAYRNLGTTFTPFRPIVISDPSISSEMYKKLPQDFDPNLSIKIFAMRIRNDSIDTTLFCAISYDPQDSEKPYRIRIANDKFGCMWWGEDLSEKAALWNVQRDAKLTLIANASTAQLARWLNAQIKSNEIKVAEYLKKRDVTVTPVRMWKHPALAALDQYMSNLETLNGLAEADAEQQEEEFNQPEWFRSMCLVKKSLERRFKVEIELFAKENPIQLRLAVSDILADILALSISGAATKLQKASTLAAYVLTKTSMRISASLAVLAISYIDNLPQLERSELQLYLMLKCYDPEGSKDLGRPKNELTLVPVQIVSETLQSDT